jgi:hypothetical protein
MEDGDADSSPLLLDQNRESGLPSPSKSPLRCGVNETRIHIADQAGCFEELCFALMSRQWLCDLRATQEGEQKMQRSGFIPSDDAYSITVCRHRHCSQSLDWSWPNLNQLSSFMLLPGNDEKPMAVAAGSLILAHFLRFPSFSSGLRRELPLTELNAASPDPKPEGL